MTGKERADLIVATAMLALQGAHETVENGGRTLHGYRVGGFHTGFSTAHHEVAEMALEEVGIAIDKNGEITKPDKNRTSPFNFGEIFK